MGLRRTLRAFPERVKTLGLKLPARGIITPMTPDLLALDGIRVIDLSRVIAGPWCGALLSDLGADVVKVEDNGQRRRVPHLAPAQGREAAAYLLFNRNKRGMALDLKTPEGVEVVTALVRDADVLIENFRTGTMESFGLGYDALATINPGSSTAPSPPSAARAPARTAGLRGPHAGVQRHHVHHGRAGRAAGGGPASSFLDLSTASCALSGCAARSSSAPRPGSASA